MTPQEMIDKGLEDGDLELIRKGRDLLKEQEGYVAQIKRSPTAQVQDVNEDGRRIARREPINLKKAGKFNLWKDDGSIPDEHPEINKKLYKKPPLKRTRGTFKYIKLICSECNKQYQIHPSLYRPEVEFVCDRCKRRQIG